MFGDFAFAELVFCELEDETPSTVLYEALLDDVDVLDVFLVEIEPYQLEPS